MYPSSVSAGPMPSLLRVGARLARFSGRPLDEGSGTTRHVISVKIPLVSPPGDMPLSTPSGQHWLIVHREDAAKLLLQVQDQMERATVRPQPSG